MKLLLILSFANLCLGGLSVSANESPRYQVVSDVDDTVKATHVTSKLAAAYNGLFRNQSFSGMPALLQGMAKSAEVTFISGSPLSLRLKLKYFLKSRNFPAHTLFLRDWFREKDQSAYKRERLERLARFSTNPFILIGDDTEADPEIYAQFASDHPGRVLAIYIHRITGQEIPADQRPFYSALDIAAWELADKRLAPVDFQKTAVAILYPFKDTQLIPRFGICPDPRYPETNTPPSLTQLGLIDFQNQVERIIQFHCQTR